MTMITTHYIHDPDICDLMLIIQPVWNPDLDVSSAKVEMQVEVASVELNTKEVTALKIIMSIMI